jgi:adenosylcobyric acid synthase
VRIADEDSLSLESRRGRRPGPTDLDLAIVRLPRISNHDDFVPLEHEPGVVVRFVEEAHQLDGADLAILPGSKSMVADLEWLRRSGIAEEITARVARREPVLGICGGYQMMGETIEDPDGVESAAVTTEGLRILPIRTRFAAPKVTAQVRARCASSSFLTEALPLGAELRGYEIHMGRIERLTGAGAPLCTIIERNGSEAQAAEGTLAADGAAAGPCSTASSTTTVSGPACWPS